MPEWLCRILGLDQAAVHEHEAVTQRLRAQRSRAARAIADYRAVAAGTRQSVRAKDEAIEAVIAELEAADESPDVT
jgi:hypothetical protein